MLCYLLTYNKRNDAIVWIVNVEVLMWAKNIRMWHAVWDMHEKLPSVGPLLGAIQMGLEIRRTDVWKSENAGATIQRIVVWVLFVPNVHWKRAMSNHAKCIFLNLWNALKSLATIGLGPRPHALLELTPLHRLLAEFCYVRDLHAWFRLPPLREILGSTTAWLYRDGLALRS